jgi:hypothetical protein
LPPIGSRRSQLNRFVLPQVCAERKKPVDTTRELQYAEESTDLTEGDDMRSAMILVWSAVLVGGRWWPARDVARATEPGYADELSKVAQERQTGRG